MKSVKLWLSAIGYGQPLIADNHNYKSHKNFLLTNIPLWGILFLSGQIPYGGIGEGF
jgi:hypothetical protein